MLSDVEKHRKELEEEELNAPDGVATPEVYAKLMACHLLEYDLCSAKFLWRRAPAAAKEPEGALVALWAVARAMWNKDLAATYTALRRPWPQHLQQAASQLEEVVRERSLRVAGRAYTSISASELATLTGLTEPQLTELVAARGWRAEAGLLLPAPPPPPPSDNANCQQALALLTQYVSFLEN